MGEGDLAVGHLHGGVGLLATGLYAALAWALAGLGPAPASVAAYLLAAASATTTRRTGVA